MSINIWTDSMQHAALLGKPVLFTNWLIQRDIIPDGWYCYDLRGTHKSPSTRTTLVDHAADYHAGTVLSPIPLKHEGTASRRVNGTFYLLGEEMTLEQFCEEHDLAYPQDNREFVLRPASLDEVGLFYSEEKLDEALGTVGHLRMDFGHGEKEFWHTWWPHNEDRFNTPEFKEVLQRFVDDLRQTGLLKNLGAMDAYGDIYGRLDDILGLTYRGGYHTQYTEDGGMEFRVWGLDVEIRNAPFASGDSAGDRFVADCEIELEVPVSFGGELLPPMRMTVKVSAGYAPRF